MRRALSLLGLLILAGCQSPAATPRPIASPRPTATAPAAVTVTATAAATIAPTVTPTMTPTMTPQPPLTIVTLGDSLTWGDKDDAPGGGWPRRLLPLLQSTRPQTQIVNLAQPGWTSRDLLQGRDGWPNQINEAVQILHEAAGDKIATVWIGVNDLFYLYEFGDPTAADEAQETDRFEADMAELLDRLQQTGARIFIARLHDPSQGPVQTNGVFMSTTAKEWARMSQQAQRYNAIITAVAAKYRAALVDIPATKIFTTPALMHEDSIHPNARGYDALTDLWQKALSSR